MIINTDNLTKLRTGFSAAYKRGLRQEASSYGKVATIVPASTKEQRYGWLGKVPNVREWLGPRQIQNLTEADYTIRERVWEMTIGVDRDDIETDNLGIYTPLFEEMGDSTTAFKDQLVWGLLAAGFATNCYDGQFFFDTDHPVLDANGNATIVANTDGGAGTAWFLLDVSRPLKPIILQTRRDFGEIIARDKATDDNVFDLNEYRYGVDARMNVGFGFWQFAWGSKQALNAANYEIARSALIGMKGDYGRPLGGGRNLLLVVPPSLEGAGRGIVQSQLVNGGESNKWAGTATLEVVPWLA